jgi:hypothetical protein
MATQLSAMDFIASANKGSASLLEVGARGAVGIHVAVNVGGIAALWQPAEPQVAIK